MLDFVESRNLKNMAHIINGKVVNVSMWDGVSAWSPSEQVVQIPDGVIAGIDWDYIDGKFVDDRLPQESSIVIEG